MLPSGVVSKKTFEGKRAIVTGAGQGIGRAIVKMLIEHGCRVVAISKTASLLSSLRDETGCETLVADLADEKATIEAANKALEAGDVHMLVCNAGVNVLEPFLEAKVESFDLVHNVNVRSVFIMCQLVARQMVRANIKGSIVNISSQASKTAFPNHTSYCTSKGALDALTQSIALELGPHGIRCNAVNPTVVLTELGKKAWEDPSSADPMRHRIPLGKFAETSDVANAVIFLLSDAAGMITGTTLPVDGGFLCCGMTKQSM